MREIGRKVIFLALTTMWIIVLVPQIINTGRVTRTFWGGGGQK